MTKEQEKQSFEGWAIVELFGHNQIAGYVTDTAQFGTSMMRVDVPETDGNPGYTKFCGGSAGCAARECLDSAGFAGATFTG